MKSASWNASLGNYIIFFGRCGIFGRKLPWPIISFMLAANLETISEETYDYL
jgi:hypothetical protein